MSSFLLRFACFPLVLLALVFGGVGCEAVESVMADIDKPTARITDVRVTDLSLEAATLEFDVAVTNPYNAAIPLANLSYALSSKGSDIFDGETSVAGEIPARATRTVKVPARVPYEPVLAVLQGVRPGAVVPYQAELAMFVDAPGVGRISLPTRTRGELPIPTPPIVEVAQVRWTQVDPTQLTAEIQLAIENENSFGMDLSQLAYTLSLSDAQVAEAQVDRTVSFRPGQTQTLTIPVSISPLQVGAAALNMARGNRGTYSIQGQIAADTPYGRLAMPYSNQGTAPFSR